MAFLDVPTPPELLTTGSVLRREALAFGVDDNEIERLLRAGIWVRIRRGAYVCRETWRAASPEARHLIVARTVLRMLDEPAVLGHVSAATLHGMPVWGADLSAVHVIRPARRHSSRREAGVVHHAAVLPEEHITTVAGVPVTTPARTVLDHARTTPFEPAVTSADAALHAALCTPAELLEMLSWMLTWPGARAAGRVVAFADGRAESVGESRGRVFCLLNGLPIPELQVEIRDASGLLLARVDFLFRAQRTIGEFDGRVKYRVAESGLPAEEVVWLEKRREDGLRALGYEVVRIVWIDYDTPVATARRFHAAFARAAAHAGH
jgi:hypothetical protein